MSTTETDLEYISRVRLGNREAFAPLVRRYQRQVEGYCTRMLSDSEQGKDLAQETFVKAFQALHHFRADSSFKTWLFRIARNCCIDALRTRYRSKTVTFNNLLDEDVLLSSNPDLQSENTGKRVEADDLVSKVLNRLPPLYREVIVLREIEELQYEEIAETLDCSIDAVKARLKRARIEIAKILRHFNDN